MQIRAALNILRNEDNGTKHCRCPFMNGTWLYNPISSLASNLCYLFVPKLKVCKSLACNIGVTSV